MRSLGTWLDYDCRVEVKALIDELLFWPAESAGLSLAVRARTALVQPTSSGSEAVPRATQRMAPVNPSMSRRHGALVVQMTVFLPQFVGKKKGDDEQRND